MCDYIVMYLVEARLTRGLSLHLLSITSWRWRQGIAGQEVAWVPVVGLAHLGSRGTKSAGRSKVRVHTKVNSSKPAEVSSQQAEDKIMAKLR